MPRAKVTTPPLNTFDITSRSGRFTMVVATRQTLNGIKAEATLIDREDPATDPRNRGKH